MKPGQSWTADELARLMLGDKEANDAMEAWLAQISEAPASSAGLSVDGMRRRLLGKDEKRGPTLSSDRVASKRMKQKFPSRYHEVQEIQISYPQGKRTNDMPPHSALRSRTWRHLS